jgi:internalin A
MIQPVPRVALVLGAVLSLASLAACDDDKPSSAPGVAATASTPAAAVPSAAAPAPSAAVPTAAAPAPSAAPSPAPKKQAPCSKDATVAFADANTETIVRRQLQKPTGPIPRSDLPKIHTLDLTKTASDDLDLCMVSDCTGVRSLYFPPGPMDDITLVKRFTQLQTLGLVSTQVKDLSPIQGLGNMDRLMLSHAPIEDISVVASLKKLTEIYLDDTAVTDLSPLAKTPLLEVVSIKNTRIADISPLRGLKSLQKLYISGSLVKDVSPVSGIPRLKIFQDE